MQARCAVDGEAGAGDARHGGVSAPDVLLPHAAIEPRLLRSPKGQGKIKKKKEKNK